MKVRLIKAYTYRTAQVRNWVSFPREMFRELEDELVKQAGWRMPDNHVVFVFRGGRIETSSPQNTAVWFHDGTAAFGDLEARPY